MYKRLTKEGLKWAKAASKDMKKRTKKKRSKKKSKLSESLEGGSSSSLYNTKKSILNRF